MQSSDGEFYLTDVGDTEQILRLVQSIPSKNAKDNLQALSANQQLKIENKHTKKRKN